VIIMYDDSDGSYDHVMPPIVNNSQTVADALTGPGECGTHPPRLAGHQGRCGYGPRLPFVVISPWSRPNFVDHTLTDQSSVIRFIEDNWQLGRIGDPGRLGGIVLIDERELEAIAEVDEVEPVAHQVSVDPAVRRWPVRLLELGR
jgi:hypothetical protein